jgi:hypothetical protein
VAEPTRPGGKHEAGGPGGPRARALVLWAAGLLVVAVGAGLALMLPARSSLLDARREVLAGRDALLAADPGGARQAFGRAEGAFRDARDQLGNPLTRLASVIPILGRTPDAIIATAEAGVLVARAGGTIATATEDLPGGLAALAPRDGAIPLEPIEALTAPLAEARDLVVGAAAKLDRAPRTLVPEIVTGPVERFAQGVAQARQALVPAAALAGALPSFLGAEGPRRYFVGAQNPAELRGTGGLIGAFSILTVADGRLEFGPFRDSQDLDRADPDDLQPPNPDYAEIYREYGSVGEWSNINMTPDVPSAAIAIERLYRKIEGDRLDGTILTDPAALASLLGAVGPAEVPGTRVTLDAGTLVPFVTNEAYSRFPNSSARKRILGVVAGEVLARFFSGASGDPSTAGHALVDAASGGHLLLHATDPDVQSALERAGVAGALGTPEGDYVAVVVNNAGGNKIDFYAERRLRYDVELTPDGTAVGSADVRIVNQAPAEGQPAYVIGPHPFTDASPGENLMLVSTYCARGCSLFSFRHDGTEEGVAQQEELGYPLFLFGGGVPSGRSTELSYRWTVPRAWSGDEYGGTYRLTVRSQPTIRPTTLDVEVRIPEGMRIVGTSPGVRVSGDRITWAGEIQDSVTLEVEFARKLFGVL